MSLLQNESKLMLQNSRRQACRLYRKIINRMKNAVLIGILVLLNSTLAFAADDYKIGDKLYVWAKNGLNVRTGAGTDFEVLTNADFGAQVIVLEKTDVAYQLAAITKVYISQQDHTKPLYFDGNWVKIRTENGDEGYVIDQYLLKVKPFQKKISEKYKDDYKLNIQSLSVDTISKKIVDGGVISFTKLEFFEYGITHVLITGDTDFDELHYLPNFSLEEAMILFSNAWDHPYAEISKSSKTEIYFYPTEMCDYIFTHEDGFVKVYFSCSC